MPFDEIMAFVARGRRRRTLIHEGQLYPRARMHLIEDLASGGRRDEPAAASGRQSSAAT